MREQIKAFSIEYDASLERLASDGDEQRTLHYPLIMFFIGDQSLEALNYIYDLNEKRLKNHKGILYFHIYSDKTVTKENVYSFCLGKPRLDLKEVRRGIYNDFFKDNSKLIELNRLLRQSSNRLAELGSKFTSLQRLHISMVTRIDDPSNILLQEFTILLKSIFAESYKSIQLDLYGLIKEKNKGEDYAFSSSLGVSFLNELELYQNRDYTFNAPLQVTEELVWFDVVHAPEPLFELVYLLSDKDERGLFADRSMESNYEIISMVNLLKNRKLVDEYTKEHENYSNPQFKQNINSSDTKGNAYISGGLSKVKPPNQAIALTVLYHFYSEVVKKLIEQSSHIDKKQIISLLELDEASLDHSVRLLMPEHQPMDDMNGLLSKEIPYNKLQKLTLEQAEKAMYGDSCHSFFETHFITATSDKFNALDLRKKLQATINHNIIENAKFGFYSAYLWTSEHEDSGVFAEIQRLIKELDWQLDEANTRLDVFNKEIVEDQHFTKLPFFTKANTKKYTKVFFEKVYGHKNHIVYLKTKLSLLRQTEQVLHGIHDQLKGQIQQVHELEGLLRDMSREWISEAKDNMESNISEYYSTVVDQILQELENKRGAQFYWEDRYLGNVSSLIEQGESEFLKKLIEVCKREIFTFPQFKQTFEDELLHRANVTTSYDNKAVLTKEDLFKVLNRNLEEQASIHIEVLNYTHKNRYEEKYLFGDTESEFVRYVFAHDQASRNYKLGIIHEIRTSGIEKLNLMGGFQIEDLMYVVNGKRYYYSYLEKGFEFHSTGISVNKEALK